jgi:hypothetical protein
LAVGIGLRHATPLWVPILLAVAAVERSVLAESGIAVSQRISAVLDMALFALPAVGLAARMLRMTDEQWSRWSPLGSALYAAGDATAEGRHLRAGYGRDRDPRMGVAGSHKMQDRVQ